MSRLDIINFCVTGNLKALQKLYNDGILNKEEINKNDCYIFRILCQYGHLEICEWVHANFGITKEDISLDNYITFRWACIQRRYDVIIFLFNTVGLTT
jgi:hypothetical protein